MAKKRANRLPNADVRIGTSVSGKTLHIENYDDDNGYPQRMDNIRNSSKTIKAAVGLYAKFIRGGGFIDPEFFKMVINTDGHTSDDLLRRISDDLACHRGCVFHINFDISLNPVDVKYVPFENARKSKSDKEEYSNKIALYDGWYSKDGVKKSIKLDDIDFIDKFDLDPAVITEQILTAGGIENYKGQCLYFSMDYERYPLASFDVVVIEGVSEAASSQTTYTNLRNNFSDKTVITLGSEFETEAERIAYIQNLVAFQGPEGESLLLLEGSTDEKGQVAAPSISKIPNSMNDKVFEYSDNKVSRGVIRQFFQPGILHTDTDTSALGRDDIEAAAAFYNKITEDERIMVEGLFKKIFSQFNGGLQPEQGFSVAKYSYYEATEGTLFTSIGIGGVQALVAILTDPVLSVEQKKQTLIIVFGVTEENAIKLITENSTS